MNTADNKVEIPIDLPDSELLVLFKQAHEQDITFNQFVERALMEFLERKQTEFLTKAVVEHLERQQNDQVQDKLDGSSQHGLVQGSWPYPS